MIHIVNSCLSELGVGSVMFDTALFSLKNDLKQIQIKDSFCKFRAYFVGILPEKITYNVYNQTCQVPLHLHLQLIYLSLCIYLIPNSMTIFIYFKLVRYVRKMNEHVTPINILYRAKR
ncbi:unnamed protein product [Rotaria sp. Silwood1]|nr:unnamed protein product [Rotaria sp. Silwood1]CAF3680040.1 unnamed protein product [Rotaria sp. Silwood1]CAF4664230.1 unnamed protein product [Rotaria sp. Silwood1]CAF4769560.1 unnamed protein product [Rotaria sp. Silwood1]CAF4872358.1 unnamed protein product [Rotaria sp. Silwood1]